MYSSKEGVTTHDMTISAPNHHSSFPLQNNVFNLQIPLLPLHLSEDKKYPFINSPTLTYSYNWVKEEYPIQQLQPPPFLYFGFIKLSEKKITKIFLLICLTHGRF